MKKVKHTANEKVVTLYNLTDVITSKPSSLYSLAYSGVFNGAVWNKPIISLIKLYNSDNNILQSLTNFPVSNYIGNILGVSFNKIDQYLIDKNLISKQYLSSGLYYSSAHLKFAQNLSQEYPLYTPYIYSAAILSTLMVTKICPDPFNKNEIINILLKNLQTTNRVYDKKKIISQTELEKIKNIYNEKGVIGAITHIADDAKEIISNPIVYGTAGIVFLVYSQISLANYLPQLAYQYAARLSITNSVPTTNVIEESTNTALIKFNYDQKQKIDLSLVYNNQTTLKDMIVQWMVYNYALPWIMQKMQSGIGQITQHQMKHLITNINDQILHNQDASVSILGMQNSKKEIANIKPYVARTLKVTNDVTSTLVKDAVNAKYTIANLIALSPHSIIFSAYFSLINNGLNNIISWHKQQHEEYVRESETKKNEIEVDYRKHYQEAQLTGATELIKQHISAIEENDHNHTYWSSFILARLADLMYVSNMVNFIINEALNIRLLPNNDIIKQMIAQGVSKLPISQGYYVFMQNIINGNISVNLNNDLFYQYLSILSIKIVEQMSNDSLQRMFNIIHGQYNNLDIFTSGKINLSGVDFTAAGHVNSMLDLIDNPKPSKLHRDLSQNGMLSFMNYRLLKNNQNKLKIKFKDDKLTLNYYELTPSIKQLIYTQLKNKDLVPKLKVILNTQTKDNLINIDDKELIVALKAILGNTDREITLTYSNHLLNIASFEFLPKTIYAIIGDNGTGKSTFLKDIKGFSASPIYSTGKMLLPCEKDEILYIGQEMYIPEHTTIFEAITLKAESTFSEKEKKYLKEKIAKLFDIIKFDSKIQDVTRYDPSEDEYYCNLNNTTMPKMSGGMKKKIGIIQALVNNKPIKLLLLDEIFNELDKRSIVIAELLIKAKFSNSATVLVVDHGAENHNYNKFYDTLINIHQGKLTKTILPESSLPTDPLTNHTYDFDDVRAKIDDFLSGDLSTPGADAFG